jgi:ABC-type antimicrobial peptide transport system permease subunit
VRADILRLVLRQWLLATGVGIAVGMAASFALTSLMSTLLYRVSVKDPFTFIVGPLLFLCVAAAASFIPANRATRVDPGITLR